MGIAYYLKAAGYLASLCLPVLLIGGWAMNNAWAVPLAFFVVLPLIGALLGAVFGPDPTSAEPPGATPKWLPWYYRSIPYSYVPLAFGAYAFAGQALAGEALPVSDRVGLVFSMCAVAAFSSVIAHELMHAPRRFDRTASYALSALIGYGHLRAEHFQHHRYAGRHDIGGVPMRGESAWAFVARNAPQAFCRMMRNPAIAREVVSVYALAAIIFMASVWAWGAIGGLLYLAQAAFALFTVQVINYVQHYGLTADPDRRAPTHAQAWSNNCFVANCLLLNINHHSHHHREPHVPYYELRTDPQAPQLPASYAFMFFLALVPPLWRRVMDPRVEAVRANAYERSSAAILESAAGARDSRRRSAPSSICG